MCLTEQGQATKPTGNRCPRAADATFFKMAERDGYKGYEIFSALLGFIDLILGIILSNIKASLSYRRNQESKRRLRRERDLTQSRYAISNSLMLILVATIELCLRV